MPLLYAPVDVAHGSVPRPNLATNISLWADIRCSRAALWLESHDDSETRSSCVKCQATRHHMTSWIGFKPWTESISRAAWWFMVRGAYPDPWAEGCILY